MFVTSCSSPIGNPKSPSVTKGGEGFSSKKGFSKANEGFLENVKQWEHFVLRMF